MEWGCCMSEIAVPALAMSGKCGARAQKTHHGASPGASISHITSHCSRPASRAAEWQSRYKDRQSKKVEHSSTSVVPKAYLANANVKPRHFGKTRRGEIAGWAYFGSIYNRPLQQTRFAGS